MKKIIFIIFTLLISFNTKAEIQSRELLDEIFYGCASEMRTGCQRESSMSTVVAQQTLYP